MFDYSTLTFVKFSWKRPDWPKEGATNEEMNAFLNNKPPELQAGQVLHMKDGEYVLVGDINRNFGVCDDCTNYSWEDVVEIALLPGF